MRPPRLLAVFLAILIVAGVAWWNETRPRVTPAPAKVEQATTQPATGRPPLAESRTAAPAIDPADPAEEVGESAEEPPPLQLKILVVDAAGAPQPGVRVATANTHLDQWADWRQGVAVGLTGPEGIAWVDVVFWENAPRREGPPRLLAVLAIPIEPPVMQTFDPRAIPDAPIKLVLPPTEGVRVRLVKPDGTPFVEPAKVRLVLPGRDPLLADGLRRFGAVPVAGSVLFPRVGLAPELKLEVKPENAAYRAVAATIPGPREPGVETVVTVTCGESALLVSGRLVTPDGEAFGRSPVHADVCGGSLALGAPGRTTEVWTDDAGRFALRFELNPASAAKGEVRLRVLWKRRDIDPVNGSSRCWARVTIPLPETVTGGSVDAGDVVVSGPALLAAGVVVDEAGQPVAEADVWHEESSPGIWRSFRPEGVSDAFGRFELRGATIDKSLVIRARTNGVSHVCLSPTRCERGAQNVRVVMTPAGSITGSISGLSELRWRYHPPVQVFVAGPGESVKPPVRAHGFYEGGFWAADLLPGRYSVQFVWLGAPGALHVVNDVVVVGGEQNRDPRLQDVDLRRFLKTLTVTVVDEQQRPVAETSVGARAAGDAQGPFVVFPTGKDGRADVIQAPGALEIVAVHAGYRAAVLPAITEDVTVTLKQAAPLPVTIKVADGVALPAAPFGLFARVRYLGPLTDSSRKTSDPMDPRQELGGSDTPLRSSTAVTVGEPGLYEVQLWLSHDEPDGRQSDTCEISQIGRNAIVTVGETGHPSVTVTPDPEALKLAIARLRTE